MIKFKNIVCKLALLVIFLLIGISYAHAQNTAAQPYQDSKHTYRVKIGLAANDQEWTITDGTSNYNLLAVQPFAVTYEPGADGGYDVISITFDAEDFHTGNWSLRFAEYSNQTGLCVSRRQFPITIVDNTFWLEVGYSGTDQLASSGIQIFNSQNTLVNTFTAVSAPNFFNTDVNYTVTMHKSTSFEPSNWQFTANFPDVIESFSAVVSTPNGGTALTSVGTVGSAYTVKVTPETGYNLDAVTVILTVQYKHNVLADVIRNLQVAEGIAVQVPPAATPQPPNAITIDNITTYPVIPLIPGDREQAVTILAIPSTQDITFDNATNTSETAASAASPLQNSTHYYRVRMGAVANTGTWRIEDSGNAIVNASNYTLVASKNATDALATITFSLMAPGAYTLYFTETDPTRTSSTQRAYTINLQPPFEVLLSDVGNQCSDASNKIYTALTAETTIVTHTISLPDTDPGPGTAYYSLGWSFDFAVTSSIVFASPDMEFTDITAAGATVTGSGASRNVVVPAGMHTIDVQVTYSGYYSTAHDLTVTISGATGAFAEVATTKTDIYTIYSMPQAGILAGVD